MQGVATQSIEFWSQVADEEFTKNGMNIPHSNFLNKYINQLLPVLLTAMKKVDIEEDENDEEWGVT